MQGPLAIGVSLGGLLLGALVPRLKPRIGLPEVSPLSRFEDSLGAQRDHGVRRSAGRGGQTGSPASPGQKLIRLPL